MKLQHEEEMKTMRNRCAALQQQVDQHQQVQSELHQQMRHLAEAQWNTVNRLGNPSVVQSRGKSDDLIIRNSFCLLRMSLIVFIFFHSVSRRPSRSTPTLMENAFSDAGSDVDLCSKTPIASAKRDEIHRYVNQVLVMAESDVMCLALINANYCSLQIKERHSVPRIEADLDHRKKI